MKGLINQIRAAWHHGRGSKYTRQKNFTSALDHFQAAAKYAASSNGHASVALETECIARSFSRLGDSVKAQESAEESLRLYRLEGPTLNESIRRVGELIKFLQTGSGEEES
jgi:uncharacterized protein HemY